MEQRLLGYLQRILNAPVYDVAIESPLELANKLSVRLRNRVWLKREDVQPVFSFKLRGAYNKVAQLLPEELARGVVCASTGNHAQGVALSARHLCLLVLRPRPAIDNMTSISVVARSSTSAAAAC